ncbi:MAG: hypothetical protein EON52_14450 [Actinomycetales bacterium]|nr:MAG: hypothetical protein EON52_14450 [Actinomycetales bacterium]
MSGWVRRPTAGPAAPAVGRRTHPLTGLLQGVLWAFAGVASLTGSLLGDGWGNVPTWVALLVAVVGGLALGEAAGFLQWYFTRYVIDTAEVRVERGILTKTSRRMPFERIQSVDIAEPLLARAFGLAELRIDMAGGDDAGTTLRFLTLEEARATRRLLLDRAHGREHDASVRHDVQGDLVAEASPAQVLLGTLVSLDFVIAVLGGVGLLVASLVAGQVVVFLGGVVAVGTWLIQIVGQRVIRQWGFTLHRTPDGLRIERGLLSRTSQTIPFARVQGVAVHEPFVWRRLGWSRLDVDVAGYAKAGGDDATATSSTLLPIADREVTARVLETLVPGAFSAEPDVQAPSRAWPVDPVAWRFRRVGSNEQGFTAREGWVERRTSVVPHHKVQSVEVRQGPLGRRLGLATVEIHTPDGPVDADGKNLDAETARSVALAELDLARTARRGA